MIIGLRSRQIAFGTLVVIAICAAGITVTIGFVGALRIAMAVGDDRLQGMAALAVFLALIIFQALLLLIGLTRRSAVEDRTATLLVLASILPTLIVLLAMIA